MLLYQGSVWFCFCVSGLTVRWDDGNGYLCFYGFSFVGVSDVHVDWLDVSLCMFFVSRMEAALL